jgi:hypothetical protein
VALAILAISVSSAQASGNWILAGENLAATAGFEGQLESGANIRFLTTLGGAPIELICTEFFVADGLLKIEGKSLATFKFSKCSTFISGKESMACLPGEPIVANVTGLLILHKGKTYILIEPDEPAAGGKITEISFFGMCALAPTMVIRGSAVLECVTANVCETELFENPVRQAPKEVGGSVLFPSDKLTWGTTEVRIDGTAWLRLKEPNFGLSFAGIT